jgi:hypothetical protein
VVEDLTFSFARQPGFLAVAALTGARGHASRVVSFVTRRLGVVAICGVAAGVAGLAARQTALRSLPCQLLANDPATPGYGWR